MKTLLRSFFYNLFALYAASFLVPGFRIERDVKFLLFAALIFTLLNFFLKPLIKVLFFPINFVTLGLFAWVVNVLILYILVFFVPQIKLVPWKFSGIHYAGFVIPSITFTKFLTAVLTSFLISFITSLLNWIRK